MDFAQFELNAKLEARHWWFVARRKILRAVIGCVLPPSKETLVIDVGCGTGGNIAALADDYRCVGIDPSEVAIQFAQENNPDVDFICGTAPEDLGELAQQSNCFLLMDVLEHVEDDASLFRDLVACSSTGTYFAITVPADPKLWGPHDESHGHFRRYETDRLTQLWDELPIETLLVSHFNSRLYPIIRFVRSRNQHRGKSFGAANTDLRLPPRLINGMLERIFAGERSRLVRHLQGETDHAYKSGVSLLALVRRVEDR